MSRTPGTRRSFGLPGGTGPSGAQAGPEPSGAHARAAPRPSEPQAPPTPGPHPAATVPAPPVGRPYHPPVPIAPNDFVHLHLHTEFSLLDGLGRINDLVSEASAHGFEALAITDHGALYGAVAFYQACKAKGIKPIIGVEAYVARRSMTDREGKADAQPFHLVLLARDWTGYQNLCRIITAAHLDGYYYKPRLDRELLARHSEGLIGLSACLGGEVAKALEVDDWDLARRVTGEYRDILGTDGFFLELQDHGLPEQRALNPKLLRLSAETGADLVVTNDLHYVRKDQHEAHDVLLCVGTGSNLDTPNRLRFETNEFYLKTAAEMERALPGPTAGAHQHQAGRRDDRPADDVR